LIVLIVMLSLLVLLLLLLLLLLYWRRLRHAIQHHHHHSASLTKSSTSSPLAPPRYVPGSQLSSVVDCSDVDGRWAGVAPLKPADQPADDGDDPEGSEDSVDKPPLLDRTASDASSPSVSCEQLSALDFDTVGDDDVAVTSSSLHDDVSVQRALCRRSW